MQLATEMLEEFVGPKGILERHRDWHHFYNQDYKNHKELQSLEREAMHIFATSLINYINQNPVVIYQKDEEQPQ